MPAKLEQFGKRVISGQLDGPIGSSLRGLLSMAEPVYAKIMAARNVAYDSGKKPSVQLNRPTISIGNITSGGTGKTPMVRWLGERLIAAGIRPAILLRGYRSAEGVGSDERVMLEQFLSAGGAVIEANPDRVAGAVTALAKAADIGTFVLDDGFQHRRVRRDLDIVLISAIEPFGYGHVIPRGLLREPLVGLKRAGAIVITHAKRVSGEQLEAIKSELQKHYPAGRIYCADHVPTGFRTQRTPTTAEVDRFDEDVRDEPVLAVCGLGDPRVFEEQLKVMGTRVVATEWFADHHDYSADDLDAIYRRANSAGAKKIITTEKDWVKLQRLPVHTNGTPIWRLDVVIQFWGDDERVLLDQVMTTIRHARR